MSRKSKVLAAMIAASSMMLAQSMTAAPAHAGVLGSLKSAAKSVGGAVKHTAVGIGSAVKVGAGLAKKLPPVGGVINAGKAVNQIILHRK